MYLSGMAYVLVSGLRRLGSQATEPATPHAATIREKLFKIGARVRVSVRRVWLSMASSYPYQRLFQQVWANLTLLKRARQEAITERTVGGVTAAAECARAALLSPDIAPGLKGPRFFCFREIEPSPRCGLPVSGHPQPPCEKRRLTD
jgi:hypothetical protein